MRVSLPSQFSDAVPRIGRRAAARLRLSTPGKVVTIYETQPCLVVNLSRTGAQVSLPKPMSPGEAVFLEMADKEHFATVMWSDKASNGLEFEVPLTDEQVFEVRDFTDRIDKLEQERLRSVARQWITGAIR